MVTVEGGCLCGAIRIKSTGDVVAKALCHCLDCRKITGSLFSTNIIVPEESFSVTKGTPKEFAKTADSGKTMTSYFCGDCGSTLWRASETYRGSKIIKAGTLDGDALEDTAKPAVELFVKNRIPWLPAFEGTQLNKTA
ncbi:DUF636 domain protein [Stachybotrys elegans]|uniref:DUF636 domain protein n=1 Tax=Stachybotrys elegans TaxID=80388 RepID=A0A8K0SHR4_9HYPO|nr:DUF636 domain protein [Stachybotrys elegans]